MKFTRFLGFLQTLLCIRASQTSGTTTPSPTAALSCPTGWQNWASIGRERCFKAFCGRKNFNNAKADCNRYGGHLAMVNTWEVNARVRAELVWGTPSFWVGASESSPENEYRWLKDSTVVGANNFTNWRSGEPNNAKGVDEECMMVGYSPSTSQTSFEIGLTDNRWYDVPCCIELPYVCEIEASTTLPSYLQSSVNLAMARCPWMAASHLQCPYDYAADDAEAVAFIIYMTFIGLALVVGSVLCCWSMQQKETVETVPGPTVNKMMGP